MQLEELVSQLPIPVGNFENSGEEEQVYVKSFADQTHAEKKPNFFKGDKCAALAAWVKPLSEVPNLKSLQSIAGKGLIAEYTKLFVDDNFIPIFGKPFDALSKWDRRAVFKHMGFTGRKCGKRSEPDIKFYVSLHPSARLRKPFGNNTHWDYTYASVVEYVQRRREAFVSAGVGVGEKPTLKQQEKISLIENPRTLDKAIDLSGIYEGRATCAGGYVHNATLKVGLRKGDEYSAQLTIEETGRMENIPVSLRHTARGIETKLGRGGKRIEYLANGKSVNGSYFLKREYQIIKSSKFGGYTELTLKPRRVCSEMKLARFTPIPEFVALPNKNPTRPANECFSMLVWAKDALWAYNSGHTIRERYLNVLEDYDPTDAYFYALAYHRFGWSFGLYLEELSDKSLNMFLEQFRFCQTKSARRKQITRNLDGIWFEKDIEKNRVMLQSYNLKGKRSYNDLTEFLKEAVATEDTLASQKTVENLVKRFTNEFAALPREQFMSYLDALAERASSQKLMAQLAREKGLTRIPKLPLSSEKSHEVTPNDETLPSFSQDEVEELGKPLILRVTN